MSLPTTPSQDQTSAELNEPVLPEGEPQVDELEIDEAAEIEVEAEAGESLGLEASLLEEADDLLFGTTGGQSVELPVEFTAEGEALELTMRSDGDLGAACHAFVAAVFRKPEAIVPAFDWLVNHFRGSMAELAKLAKPSDLVSELSLNGRSLTNAVAIHWDSTGQVHRLVRLAEALLASQHKLGNANAAEFEVALAGSLAFGRPKIARQLIDAAAPHLPESEATLTLARQNLSAGSLLQQLPAEPRIFWTHQLRSPHRQCDWSELESVRAIDQLAAKLDFNSPEAVLFEKSTPDAVWKQVLKKAANYGSEGPSEVRSPPANSPSAEVAGDAPSGNRTSDTPSQASAEVIETAGEKPSLAPVPAQDSPGQPTQVTQPSLAAPATSAWPMMLGGLLLGLLIAGGGGWWWLEQRGLLKLIQQGNSPATQRAEPQVAVTSEAKPTKQSEPVSQPHPPEPAKVVPTAPKLSEIKPVIPPATPPKLMNPSLTEPMPRNPMAAASPVGGGKRTPPVIPEIAKPSPPPPVVVTPPPPPPPTAPKVKVPAAVPATAYEKWQHTATSALDQLFPSLHTWHDMAARAKVLEIGPLIVGTHPTAFASSKEHRGFLKWLVIDPPQDPEITRAVLNTLMRLSPPGECLELFEPICQHQASNAADVRRAADVMVDLFADKLTPEETRRLKAVVDTGKAKTKSSNN